MKEFVLHWNKCTANGDAAFSFKYIRFAIWFDQYLCPKFIQPSKSNELPLIANSVEGWDQNAIFTFSKVDIKTVINYRSSKRKHKKYEVENVVTSRKDYYDQKFTRNV